MLQRSGLRHAMVRLRGGWHPNLTVYDTTADRRFEVDADAPSPGLFTDVVLAELQRLGNDPPRFTVVHLMGRLGFGPADVNCHAVAIENGFEARVLGDPVLALAAANGRAPHVTVFRGAGWRRYIERLALAERARTDLAMRLATRPGPDTAPAALAAEAADPDAPPFTVIGYRALADAPPGAIDPAEVAAQAAGFPRVRAWPAYLRRHYTAHIHALVRDLVIVPVSPNLPVALGLVPAAGGYVETAAAATVRWLRRIRRRSPPPGTEWTATDEAAVDALDAADQVDLGLETTVYDHFRRHPYTDPGWLAAELDEAALCASVAAAIGPVTLGAAAHLTTHMQLIGSMLAETHRHDRRFWSEAKRERLTVDPLDVAANFRRTRDLELTPPRPVL